MTDLDQAPAPGSPSGRHRPADEPDEEIVVDAVLVEDEEASEDTPRGRHGTRSNGLSAAELIARARAETVLMAAVVEPVLDEPTTTTAPETVLVDAAVVDTSAAGTTATVEAATGISTVEPATAEPVTAEPSLESEIVPAAKPVGRAGRNLPAAIAVGGGLGAVIVLSLLLYRPSFAVIVGLAVVVGVYEMVTAINTVEARPPLVPLLAGSVAMIAAAWFAGPDGLVGALLITVLGLFVWRLADGATGYLADVGSAALISLYVPFLAGFAVLSTHAHDGAARILLFVLTVVCSDTGGYAVGVLAGRTPMAPAISPKKSWEGFSGSVVTSCVAGALVMSLTFHEQWWKGVVFGAAIAVTATLGDLGESMIKRDLGIKDMGHLLPGHGGIMDRLDSLLPCAAVAYLLLAAFVGPAG